MDMLTPMPFQLPEEHIQRNCCHWRTELVHSHVPSPFNQIPYSLPTCLVGRKWRHQWQPFFKADGGSLPSNESYVVICHVMLRCVALRYIIIMLCYLVQSCFILFDLIFSYIILSFLFLSYLTSSYLTYILSFLILSYLILSYLISSYLILSYFILPYLITSSYR